MPSFFPASEQPAGSTRQLLRESDGAIVRRTVLPTGLRVVSEAVPGVRAVTLGIWAGVGSRDETRASAGAAHFLEHLLFKGTNRRSALDIAAEVDAVGGQMNAFTSKEFTCFYAKVLGSALPVAVDVMMDITTDPLLATSDIDAERSVIVEEIAMHEDDPADRASEAIETAVLARNALSLPILGTRESIGAMSTRTIRAFFRRHYRPEGLAVTASGDVDHQHLVRLVRDATKSLDWPWGMAPLPLNRSTSGDRGPAAPGGLTALAWPGEQCNVSVAFAGLPRAHPDRRPLDVLNGILGGGMSSRLFQSVREQRGLAYAVYSLHNPYSDAGVWSASAGCQPGNAVETLAVMRAEFDRLLQDGVSEEEVARAKGHLSGSLVLSTEDTSTRMVALGRAEVASGELIGIDESLARIEAVTGDDVMRVARDLLSGPVHVCTVGAPEGARDEIAAVMRVA